MAITESDYLYIHSGPEALLLLRSPTHFHLIHIDAAWNQRKLERLLRLYPCETAQLQSMGLKVSAFRAENLRGVVIHGYRTGESLDLWIGTDSRTYALGLDYSAEFLSRFFAGCTITDRTPPQHTGLDPAHIRRITWSLNGVSIICALLFFINCAPYRLLSWLCVLCQVTALLLAFWRRDSFTLVDDMGKCNPSASQRKGHLLPALLAPACALTWRSSLDFTYPGLDYLQILGVLLVGSLILLVVHIWVNGGLRYGLIHAVGVILCLVLFGSGTVAQLNFLLDFHQPVTQRVPVVDLDISQGIRATSYSCTVRLPSGEEVELTLTAEDYRSLQIGDEILLTQHEGAFGLPFSIIEPRSDLPTT